MACQVQIREEWNSDEAKRWWRSHLPQLTGPLTLGEHRDTAAAITM